MRSAVLPLLALGHCLACVGCDDEPSKPTPTPPAKATKTEPDVTATPAGNEGALNSRGLSPKEVESACQQVCEKTSKLPCVQVPECVAGCLDSFQMPACRGELGAMLRCTEEAPAEAFLCDDSPTPILKDGACEAEQEKAARCLEQLMRSGQAGP